MIERAALIAGVERLAAAMEREAAALNAADAALGDGDLGVTMTRGMRLVAEGRAELPADLGQALMRCAQAFTKTSGSSYGTLLATGLMAAAKALKGRETVAPAEVSGLIAAARDAVALRGKAELGGKTVLDSLEAMARASAGLEAAEAVAEAVARAAAAALEALRDHPATIGRARIFAERSRGLNDPGMLAMSKIAAALTRRD